MKQKLLWVKSGKHIQKRHICKWGSNGLRHVVLGFINFYVKKNKASKVVVLFLDCKFLFQTKQEKMLKAAR